MADPLSIITSIITLLDTAKKAYNTVQDATHLPEAFLKIYSRIDLATETLVEIRERYKGNTNEEDKIKATLQQCAKNADDIKKMYVAVCTAANSDWLPRQRGYVSNMVHDRKTKLEDLWRGLLEGLQVLQGYHLFKNLPTRTKAQVAAEVLENDPVEQGLRALSEASRTTIKKERQANCLQFDANTNIVTISVPSFQTSTFEHSRAWQGSKFQSSTFQLADVLEILPGQKNHNPSNFQVKELQAHEYVYGAPCSRLGLLTFLCRHFHSFTLDEGRLNIRTIAGTFQLVPRGRGAVVYFSSTEEHRAPATHLLASDDITSLRRFATGQIRLSSTAFELAFGRVGNDDERWTAMTIATAILTPSLDHPPCMRFTTQTEHHLLETSREFCKAVMRTFIRLVDEGCLTGTEAIDQWDLIMSVIRQFRDADFASPESVRMVTDAYWGICTMAMADQDARTRILRNVVEDLREMLDGAEVEPSVRSARVRDYLTNVFGRYGLPYVCCFAAHAFLVSMNCSIFLTISVVSPQLWLDFISSLEGDIVVA